MKIFEGTNLPDDFFAQVRRYLKIEHRNGADATADAVFAVLGRPLMPQERLAIIDAIHSGRLVETADDVNAETSSAMGPK